MCLSQAGRAREGRARRSHRVRTDMVLTALGGDAQGRVGRWLPTWAHGVTAFTNNTNNSNNTHRHQSGRSHSALDLDTPTWGRGMGRVGDDEVSVQPEGNWPTRWSELWNCPQDEGRSEGVGQVPQSSLTASTRLLPIVTRTVEPAPRAKVEVAAATGRQPAWGLRWLGWGSRVET